MQAQQAALLTQSCAALATPSSAQSPTPVLVQKRRRQTAHADHDGPSASGSGLYADEDRQPSGSRPRRSLASAEAVRAFTASLAQDRRPLDVAVLLAHVLQAQLPQEVRCGFDSTHNQITVQLYLGWHCADSVHCFHCHANDRYTVRPSLPHALIPAIAASAIDGGTVQYRISILCQSYGRR